MYKKLLICLLAVLAFSSCEKSLPSGTQSTSPQSGLFIIHASADAPPVDIFANNTQINTQPFGFTDNSEGYLSMNSNIYNFVFKSSGTQNTLVSQTDSLGVYKQYTMILYDSVADPKLMFIQDDFANASDLFANFRVLDLCPNLPSMNIYLDTTELWQGRTFADNLHNYALDTFAQTSAEDHELTLRFPYLGDTATYSTQLPLYEGKIYTIFVSGYAGGVDSLGLQVNIAVNY